MRHNTLFGAECFDSSFALHRSNRYVPQEADLKLRRLESAFTSTRASIDSSHGQTTTTSDGFERVATVTDDIAQGSQTIVAISSAPSDTLRRVGEHVLPRHCQAYLHRHVSDVGSTVHLTARFFLACLQPKEQEVGKVYRQGTMTQLAKSWNESGFLVKMMIGRVILRCMASRLYEITNEAAVAGIQFNVSLTSPLNEGQVALELSISGYSGNTTRNLFKSVFEALLETTETQLGDLQAAIADVKQVLTNSMNNCKCEFNA